MANTQLRELTVQINSSTDRNIVIPIIKQLAETSPNIEYFSMILQARPESALLDLMDRYLTDPCLTKLRVVRVECQCHIGTECPACSSVVTPGLRQLARKGLLDFEVIQNADFICASTSTVA